MTFNDYRKLSASGPKIDYLRRILIECKVFSPTVPSVMPDGYWYRIQESPWNSNYYAAANTFLNGDPIQGPYTHYVDQEIPDC